MTRSRIFVDNRCHRKSWLAIAGGTALIFASLAIASVAQDSGVAVGKVLGGIAGDSGKWTHARRLNSGFLRAPTVK